MNNLNNNTVQDDVSKILIVDDEENMRHMLYTVLNKLGYDVDAAADGEAALTMFQKTDYDFILCDIKMPKMDGMAFLNKIKGKTGSTIVIMMSAYGTMETAIEAMKLGAYDYISKPFKIDEVHIALKKAEERESLRKENLLLKEHIKIFKKEFSFDQMVARSKNMRDLFNLSEKVAQYNTTVLIIGASGTGKELVAKGIHNCSSRAEKPIVPVNCGGIPETLLESELFGHKKGAFTGADKDKKGLFKVAEGGTIFLDEIGELPLSLQVKLLRVLQENEIRPVGDSRISKIDVRVIAATSKNLEEEIKAGTFREDLYYRLNVLKINLPPLNDRKEDLPLLCRHFISKCNKRLGTDIVSVSAEALSLMMEYNWPGNVRELENMIERAVVLSDGDTLVPENFSKKLSSVPGEVTTPLSYSGYSLKEAKEILEKEMIIKALEKTNGNRTKAVQLLDISHPSLLSKMKTYGIDM